MDEFSLIRSYFDIPALTSPSNTPDPFLALQIGDDCALLQPNAGQQLAVSVDTLVAGVHFLPDMPADKLAWRAMAVCVSDLAAMGALPKAFTLALTLPESSPQWLAKFSTGLAAVAKHYKISLIGGDTTKGPLTITLQVMGEIPCGQAIRRSGAKVGDKVFVSNDLGGANLALSCLQSDHLSEEQLQLQTAYFSPLSCIDLGIALRGIATAGIDISDGLLADVGHIAKQSHVGIRIDAQRIPLNSAGHSYGYRKQLLAALSGGDDYQLCFTASANTYEQLQAIAGQLAVTITEIGSVHAGEGVSVYNTDVVIEQTGFNHFG